MIRVERTGHTEKVVFVAFATFAYLVFVAVFAYSIAFFADVGVGRSISGTGRDNSTLTAVVIDLTLLGLFSVQHSVMARPGFKRCSSRVVPSPVERSTYVLAASAFLALLYWQWRPIDTVIWHLDGVAESVSWGIFALGWSLILWSTFLIDHFELFGLRQVAELVRGRTHQPAAFRTPHVYRFIRHPLMVGFFIVFWATPFLTVGHLLFAGVTTIYIVVAVRFEERDLVADLPEYGSYMAETPRYFPHLRRRQPANPADDPGAGEPIAQLQE